MYPRLNSRVPITQWTSVSLRFVKRNGIFVSAWKLPTFPSREPFACCSPPPPPPPPWESYSTLQINEFKMAALPEKGLLPQAFGAFPAQFSSIQVFVQPKIYITSGNTSRHRHLATSILCPSLSFFFVLWVKLILLHHFITCKRRRISDRCLFPSDNWKYVYVLRLLTLQCTRHPPFFNSRLTWSRSVSTPETIYSRFLLSYKCCNLIGWATRTRLNK